MKCEFNPSPAVETYGKMGKVKQFAKLFKMSATDEVAEVNTFNRTNLVTISTTCALAVIYGGKIVFNLDCSFGAIFLTLHTAYASVGAYLANLSALVVAGALNNNARGIVNKMNNVVGTSLCTETAANTLSGVNLSDKLLRIDANSITGTHLHTVAVAKAGEGAITVTGEIHICADAGLDSVVNVLSLGGKARAVTSNVSNLLNDVTCSKTHNLTDFGSDTVTTGNTKAGVIGCTLGECLCITVTSGEAASTTVGTGKAITNCKSTLILLNSKEHRGKDEKHCANECNQSKN